FAVRRAGFSPWSLAVLAFLLPAVTMPVAPGADMAMHVALARGLLDGVLSPAWPGVHAGAYPRGFSALVALLSPLGLARAGLLALCTRCTRRTFRGRGWVPLLAGVAGLCVVLVALAVFGPALSPRELQWLRDYAVQKERVGIGVLGDAANAATALAAAWLLWKRDFRPVALATGAVLALFALFFVLPYAGFYPVRFGPLLLLAIVPLWARAAAAR